MSKRVYPDQDINDLVNDDLNPEETFYKGGVGSGVKGHRTMKDYNFSERAKTGGLDKKRGAMQHFDQMYRDAKANNDPTLMEHYKDLKNKAAQAVLSAMSPKQKDAKIKENDAKISGQDTSGKFVDELKSKMRTSMDIDDIQGLADHLGLDTAYSSDGDEDYASERDHRANLVTDILDHVKKNPSAKSKVDSYFK